MDLVGRRDAAVEHEFDVYHAQTVQLVEIEEVKEDWSTLPTSDFVLKLVLGEQYEATEEFQGVYEPVAVLVPYGEAFVFAEDLLELSKVNREVSADALERAVVLTKFRQRHWSYLITFEEVRVLPEARIFLDQGDY